MSIILSVASQTFLQLRRDKAFLPVLIGLFVIFIFSHIVSEWGIEDIRKLFFDFGFFFLFLFGSAVAIFWGARDEEDKDLSLAAPISRWQWVLGRYLGIVMTLSLLGVFLLLFWQLAMFAIGFSWMTADEFVSYLGIMLSWFVVASFAQFFSTAGTYGSALFSSSCVWVIANISRPLYESLPKEANEFSSVLLSYLATYFDLQKLNFMPLIEEGFFMKGAAIETRFIYGFSLLAVFVLLSTIAFEKKEI